MKSMFLLEMKKNLKDKGLIFWTLLLPIAFIVAFASIFGGDNNEDHVAILHYYDEDNSEVSQALLDDLANTGAIELNEESDLTESIDNVGAGELPALIHIPNEFGEQIEAGHEPELFFYYETVREEVAAPVIAVLENVRFTQQQEHNAELVAENIEDEEAAAAFFSPPFEILYEAQEVSGGVEPITHLIPGYAVMFTFFIMISMVTSFIKDQRSGMLSRLAATPLKPLSYLCGKWAAFILLVFLQIVILLAFGRLVYDVTIGDFISAALISLALALTTTGLGLGMSLLVNTENMGIALTQVIALGGAIVAGLWMPLEFMPEFIQQISVLLPQYWAHQAFLDIMARGGTVIDVLPALAVLLAFAAAGAIVALIAYPKYLQKAN